jgi:5'(3')-deoxyribonucleotidase
MKKVLYFDMDGVLVSKGEGCFQEHKYDAGYFLNQQPIEGAIDAFHKLSEMYDCYIASTPVWKNIYCWSEKRIWVERYLGVLVEKRLILLHDKNLLVGDIIIDDTTDHGVSKFSGEHIHFGTEIYPDWKSVLEYLIFGKNR